MPWVSLVARICKSIVKGQKQADADGAMPVMVAAAAVTPAARMKVRREIMFPFIIASLSEVRLSGFQGKSDFSLSIKRFSPFFNGLYVKLQDYLLYSITKPSKCL